MKHVDLTDKPRPHTGPAPTPAIYTHIGVVTASVFLIPLLLLIPTSLEAKIYKWVDSDGITQYTEYPPPEGIVDKEISTPNYVAKPKEALQKRTDTLNQQRAVEPSAKSGDDSNSTGQEKLNAYCENAKKRLADFQADKPLVQEQADGSFARVTEEQRTQQIATLQTKITELCG